MSEEPSRYVCPNCGAGMDGLKCKIRCPRCLYFESCSDLEPAPPYSGPSSSGPSSSGPGSSTAGSARTGSARRPAPDGHPAGACVAPKTDV